MSCTYATPWSCHDQVPASLPINIAQGCVQLSVH